MKRFESFLKEIDNNFPKPWIVNGVNQGRPVSQIGFIVGVIITTIFCFIFK